MVVAAVSESTRTQLTFAVSRLVYGAGFTLVFLLLSSSIVDAFLTKWAPTVLDPAAAQYLPRTLAFEGNRPYVYRVLTPFLVSRTVALFERTPVARAQPLLKRAVDRYTVDLKLGSLSPSLQLEFLTSAIWMVVFMFGTCWALRACALAVPVTPAIADLATLLFGLLLPLSFRGGSGFLYDFSELFFSSAYLGALVSRKRRLTPIMLCLAVINKESNILLLIYYAIYVALLPVVARPKTVRLLLEAVSALAPYLAIKTTFAHAPGTALEFHLWDNIPFWLSPSTYAIFGTTHLQFLPFPHPSNVLLMALALLFFWIGFATMPRLFKLWLAVVLPLLTFLLIFFCWKDEWRNMSLAFPAVFMSATYCLKQLYWTNESRR